MGTIDVRRRSAGHAMVSDPGLAGRFGGLRLVSGRSPDRVSGWKITSTSADAISLVACSLFMAAHKILRVQAPRATVVTFVHFNNRFARTLWSLVAPIHHFTEPYLLDRASRR